MCPLNAKTVGNRVWTSYVISISKPRQFHWMIGSIIRDEWENSLVAASIEICFTGLPLEKKTIEAWNYIFLTICCDSQKTIHIVNTFHK